MRSSEEKKEGRRLIKSKKGEEKCGLGLGRQADLG